MVALSASCSRSRARQRGEHKKCYDNGFLQELRRASEIVTFFILFISSQMSYAHIC